MHSHRDCLLNLDFSSGLLLLQYNFLVANVSFQFSNTIFERLHDGFLMSWQVSQLTIDNLALIYSDFPFFAKRILVISWVQNILKYIYFAVSPLFPFFFTVYLCHLDGSHSFWKFKQYALSNYHIISFLFRILSRQYVDILFNTSGLHPIWSTLCKHLQSNDKFI